MIHPAATVSFEDLLNGLMNEVEKGTVNEIKDNNLSLFVYSRSCVYEKEWNFYSLMARGMILDIHNKKIVSLVFPKFFNYGEREDQIIHDIPFEVYEKVDGSLIVIWWDSNKEKWRASTKGSFRSDQAKYAQAMLDENHITYYLCPGVTYLAELVGPQNRIVVHYEEPALVLLSAYDANGIELNYDLLCKVGDEISWRVAKRYDYKHISELLAKVPTLPANEEGFVIRFQDGLRLKIKGEEYLRLHRCISNCTPLFIWDAMRARPDWMDIRKELPEEFWADFDNITNIIQEQVFDIFYRTKDLTRNLADLSDKEVGLRLHEFPEKIRRFIFPYRKNGGNLLEGRSREMLFREIRPTNNILDGYTPSGAIHRITEESA